MIDTEEVALETEVIEEEVDQDLAQEKVETVEEETATETMIEKIETVVIEIEIEEDMVGAREEETILTKDQELDLEVPQSRKDPEKGVREMGRKIMVTDIGQQAEDLLILRGRIDRKDQLDLREEFLRGDPKEDLKVDPKGDLKEDLKEEIATVEETVMRATFHTMAQERILRREMNIMSHRSKTRGPNQN